MRIPKYKAYVKELDKILGVMAVFFDENMVTVEDDNGDYKQYRFDEVELMECTGLQDKNGVEICVGNLVKYQGGVDETLIAEIVYDEKYCKVQVRTFLSSCYYDDDYGDELEDLDNWTTIEHFEVIGNIYQNKELLEGEN